MTDTSMVNNVLLVTMILMGGWIPASALLPQHDSTFVKRTSDFTITGDGSALNWNTAE